MKRFSRPLFVLMIVLLVIAVLPLGTLAQDEDLEANKALVMRFTDELWGGDLTVADEILTEDFVARFPDGSTEDKETYLAETVEVLLAFLPDFSININAIIAEGDLVALIYSWGGTPESGKEARVNGVDFFRIEDGKIAEFVLTWDTLSWMQQTGAEPSEDEVMPQEPFNVVLGETSSSLEMHRETVSIDAYAVNEDYLDIMDQTRTENTIVHWGSWDAIEGRETIKGIWVGIKADNPSHRVTTGYSVYEGDLYAFHAWIQGYYLEGHVVAGVFRFEDGKIAEEWSVWDTYAPMRAAAAEESE